MIRDQETTRKTEESLVVEKCHVTGKQSGTPYVVRAHLFLVMWFSMFPGCVIALGCKEVVTSRTW